MTNLQHLQELSSVSLWISTFQVAHNTPLDSDVQRVEIVFLHLVLSPNPTPTKESTKKAREF